MDKNDIIEYVMHTPHNTNRAVLNSMLNQLAEGEDGGGLWTVLTEESVTTESDISGYISGALSYEDSIIANTIKVTLDGNEYTLDATVSEAPGGHEYRYGGEGYTFTLASYDGEMAPLGGRNHLFTETAGTYTIKIEAPQSGGSSDFSTAEVTVVANNTLGSCTVPRCIEAGELAPEAPAMLDAIVSFENEEIVFNAVLYKGMAVADFASNRVTSVTGGAMWDEEDSSVYIMGNCTITVTDA